MEVVDDMTYDEWEALGKRLKFVESAVGWWVGDWVNYGEKVYGEMYAQALDATDYTRGTLMVYASVARSVKTLNRFKELGIKHHMLVAPLDDEQQRRYLSLAVKEELSVSKLAQRMETDKIADRLHAAIEAAGGEVLAGVDLIQGDMLEVLPRLGKTFDLVIADPPYNVTPYDFDQFGSRANFLSEVNLWLEAIRAVLKPDFNLFLFCAPTYAADIELLLRTLELPVQSRLIWHRRNMAMGSDATYKFIDTWEMVFHCGNRALNWSPEWSDERFDVQTFPVPQSNFTDARWHPTQKPIELIERLVRFGSYPGDAVLDPFAGAGTTGLTCLNTGYRHCTLVELSKDYVDAARARLHS